MKKIKHKTLKDLKYQVNCEMYILKTYRIMSETEPTQASERSQNKDKKEPYELKHTYRNMRLL